jgi:hypothetical protein
MINEKILQLDEWLLINRPIYELGETKEEYEKRNVYLFEKINEKDLSNKNIDWHEFEQLPEESFIDYAIRFSEEYADILDCVDFIPDYYKVIFDFNKEPHIVLNSENPIFDKDNWRID